MRVALLGVALMWALPAFAATTPARRPATRRAAPARRPVAKRPTGPVKPVKELAAEARLLEDAGAYGRATATLQVLRSRVARDADLELALAIDEARAGALDSARARLRGPLLEAALADTLPEQRRTTYGWGRDQTWIDGRYTGWPWVIARARAEVAAALGRWSEARDAAAAATAMLPLAGVEHAILAVCLAKTGDLAGAATEAFTAVELDPALPEAHDLAGLFLWRQGRRAEAARHFMEAVRLDSTDMTAALAGVRLRLPGAAPDSLPAGLLHGIREAGLVTSPVGPKPEQFEQMETPAVVLKRDLLPIPDSLMVGVKPVHLVVTVLVDRNGRAVFHELPWFSARDLPAPVVARIVASLPEWRFRPASLRGETRAVWASVEVVYQQP